MGGRTILCAGWFFFAFLFSVAGRKAPTCVVAPPRTTLAMMAKNAFRTRVRLFPLSLLDPSSSSSQPGSGFWVLRFSGFKGFSGFRWLLGFRGFEGFRV